MSCRRARTRCRPAACPARCATGSARRCRPPGSQVPIRSRTAAYPSPSGGRVMTDLLEEMIRDASKRAEKCFKKHGSIATQYFALCSDGEFIGFEAGFSNAAERDYSRMMVRALFAERNVQRYVHVAECWTTTKESKVAPKDDPNRQEGI